MKQIILTIIAVIACLPSYAQYKTEEYKVEDFVFSDDFLSLGSCNVEYDRSGVYVGGNEYMYATLTPKSHSADWDGLIADLTYIYGEPIVLRNVYGGRELIAWLLNGACMDVTIDYGSTTKALHFRSISNSQRMLMNYMPAKKSVGKNEFKTADDVIIYLGNRLWEGAGNSIKINFNGLYINGIFYGGIPDVLEFAPTTAKVKCGNFVFDIDRQRWYNENNEGKYTGSLYDESSDTYYVEEKQK